MGGRDVGGAARLARRCARVRRRAPAKLRWSFHTIPHPGEFGYDTWPKDAWTYTGSANNWAGMALDEKRGIVYAPTGSAAADFYGANRVGDNLFANTLLALDAEYRQAPLALSGGEARSLGSRFSFAAEPGDGAAERPDDRCRGADHQARLRLPVRPDRRASRCFPIESRKYPASTVPGEVAAETQSLPTQPAPFARQIADGGHADQSDAGSAPVGARAVREVHQRGPVRSAERR